MNRILQRNYKNKRPLVVLSENLIKSIMLHLDKRRECVLSIELNKLNSNNHNDFINNRNNIIYLYYSSCKFQITYNYIYINFKLIL